MRTVPRERLQTMHLEIPRFNAAQATRVDVGTARAVSPIHLALYGCRDVSAALARRFRRRFRTFARFAAFARVKVWTRPLADGELSLFERRDQQLHRFEVELAERDCWLRPRVQTESMGDNLCAIARELAHAMEGDVTNERA
jgi:hypothetical protein